MFASSMGVCLLCNSTSGCYMVTEVTIAPSKHQHVYRCCNKNYFNDILTSVAADVETIGDQPFIADMKVSIPCFTASGQLLQGLPQAFIQMAIQW